MSIVGDAINRSPMNKSTAKQMFSFSRANRFGSMKNTGCATFYYNLPDVKATRQAFIGYGTKSDFTRDSKDKTAPFYNNKSDFNQSEGHSPRWTFGESRNKFEKVYYETNKAIDKNIPGPGKYNYLKDFGHDSKKFSIIGRGENKYLSTSHQIPGPGQYPSISISKDGKYSLSSWKNTTTIQFGNSSSKRFNYLANQNPGPGKYNIKTLLDGTGNIYQSKFRSSPGKSIIGKPGGISSKWSVPGPGTYRLFSEFGIYEKPAYMKTGTGTGKSKFASDDTTKNNNETTRVNETRG